MLSRVAESLYWMSRYAERAENTARLLDVNLQLLLDFAGVDDDYLTGHWYPIVCSSGDQERFNSLYSSATSRAVTEFLTFNPQNPNSILSCVGNARENARFVRDQITGEMWQSINELYHFLNGQNADKVWQDDPYQFYQDIKHYSQLFQGLTEGNYDHDEGYKFIQAGKFLERADQTSRIIDIKYHMLLPDPRDVGSSIDIAQWTAVLRSCNAFEAYHRTYTRDIQPWHVSEFLFLSPTFPRSIRFCLGSLDYHLRNLTHTQTGNFSNRAEQLVGRLRSEIAYTTIDEVFAEGLHEYIDRLQRRLISLNNAILRTYMDADAGESGGESPLEKLPER
jgi:uncharacterized alpha-E superfamily protein